MSAMATLQCRLCFEKIPSVALSIVDAPGGAQLFQNDSDRAVTMKTTLNIAECEGCGLVQSVSPVVPYFRKVISAAGLSAGMRRHRMQQFSTFVEVHRLKGKRVLEAGCGKGDMLPILAAAGVAPTGLEYQIEEANPAAVGFGIIDGYPGGGLKVPGSPYAAFVCLNFLEHAPQPRDFLSSLRATLEPGGVGLLEVPNYVQQKTMGRAFDYVADHLSYFSPATLKLVLELSGFEVRHLVETRGGENIEAWVQRRSRFNLREDQERIESSRRALAQLLRDNGGRIAVWGASHQALTLLSGLPSCAVRAIIDSAQFKQGKYAPGSGVPVIAPTPEAVEHIDHVVIIASGYETEIATTLRRDLEYRGVIWAFKGGSIGKHD